MSIGKEATRAYRYLKRAAMAGEKARAHDVELRAIRATSAQQIESLETRLAYALEEISELRALVRYLLPESPNYQRFMAQTRESFDYQWRSLPDGAYLDTDARFVETAPEQLAAFAGLAPEWFAGKRVLDAGCGRGRWSHALCRLGAQVTAIDQSEAAVEATRRLCADFEGFEARSANLLEPLPFGADFDLVWCFGVTHHTGDTWRALRHVAAAVRPGGHLFLMVYGEPRRGHDEDYEELRRYAELRRDLAPLSLAERVEALSARFPAEEVHGWFDAVSPTVNDVHPEHELRVWLQMAGFHEIRRTLDNRNVHLSARRRES